jgi:hypothetical protein
MNFSAGELKRFIPGLSENMPLKVIIYCHKVMKQLQANQIKINSEMTLP